MWTGWLRGEHEAEHRAGVLADFGRRAGRAVLANCRVLGEGVDIRAVDSVALIDPKGSAVDIVQAIGRALRQKPGEGKIATLIVPVFLREDENPEDILTSKSYGPLIRVLNGLRAHDERAVEMLTIPQENQKRSRRRCSGRHPRRARRRTGSCSASRPPAIRRSSRSGSATRSSTPSGPTGVGAWRPRSGTGNARAI
ncbi:helicase-related protein [Streptomyces lavendulae]|uniref:helicase-related protein n=1 Tax=Streptomyces lavendulae TaxID=1914 RepID=UPI00380473ED